MIPPLFQHIVSLFSLARNISRLFDLSLDCNQTDVRIGSTVNNQQSKGQAMTITTETISTDPWKFAATAKTVNNDGTFEYTHIGEEGDSRAKCKTAAKKGLLNKLTVIYGYSRR